MSVPSEPLIEIRPDATDQSLQFFWNAPSSDGGSPITQYILTDGTTTINLSPESRYYRLSGLTNGTTYSFYLLASNANGTSPAANFRSVQPGIIPTPATYISTQLQFGSVYKVSWSNSSNLGGNTRLLNTLVTAYPYLSDGITLNTTSTNLFAQQTIVGGTSNQYQECFLTLSTNLTYNIDIRCINDAGYSGPVFSGPISTQSQFVTSSIMFSLDAGNSASYSGSGTTWFDLTGNGRNATLVNSPTYSSSNQGYFSFLDTSFQHATIPNIGSLSNWTVEAWARVTKSLTNKVTLIAGNQYDGSVRVNYGIGTLNAGGSYNMATGFYNSGWFTTTGFVPTQNTWIHFVGTYDGSRIIQYSNAIINTSSITSQSPQSGGEVRIARRWDSASNDVNNYFAGDISIVRIYSRALSPTEVLQNFNAVKSRYSL